MRISKNCLILFLTLISAILIAACGDSGRPSVSALGSDEGILRFVPADTPYVLAKPGDLPDDVMDKLDPHINAILTGYHSIIRAMLENAYAQAKQDDAELGRYESMLSVVDELEGLMSLKGLRQAGIDRNADMAVYGVGLLPVLRLELADSALLESVIADLEEAAKHKLAVASIDGNSYRYAGDEEGRVVVAVIGNHLVVAVVPTGLPESQFKEVLGLTLPAQNIVASGDVTDIAKTYGFSDYMIGIVDFEKISAIFIDPQKGINAELLALTGFDHSSLSDVCRAEIRTLSGVMPRAVSGYTTINTEDISSKLVLELRDDIARSVATTTGIVPGLSNVSGGVFSFGMSVDLLAIRTFYSERLDAMDADPFECDLLSEFQGSVAAGREILNQPLPPVAYGFNGFVAFVEDLQGMNLASNQPPTSADMRLLIAMDNAESLVAMGAMFSPELAALNIGTDAVPVKLDLPQVVATGMDVNVAMTEDALAISVGNGMESGLASMLKADAADPSPFFVLNMDTKRYFALFGDAMMSQSGDATNIPEIQAAAEAIKKSFVALFEQLRVTINFTENGIEVESDMRLAD